MPKAPPHDSASLLAFGDPPRSPAQSAICWPIWSRSSSYHVERSALKVGGTSGLAAMSTAAHEGPVMSLELEAFLLPSSFPMFSASFLAGMWVTRQNSLMTRRRCLTIAIKSGILLETVRSQPSEAMCPKKVGIAKGLAFSR